MLEIIGLLLIAAAWIFQLVHIRRFGNKLCTKFLKLYILGVILLIVDGFINGLTAIAALNLIALALASVALFRVRKTPKERTVSKVQSVRKTSKRKR